jgi:hypothetical protein
VQRTESHYPLLSTKFWFGVPLPIDPNNPVVKLCAEGIALEMAGRTSEAAAVYQQAWETRAHDFAACIVAHYVARVQRSRRRRCTCGTTARVLQGTLHFPQHFEVTD